VLTVVCSQAGSAQLLYFFVTPAREVLSVSSVIFVCSQVRVYELLQELVLVCLLSCRIKKLEESWSKSFSSGSFLNTPTRCSMKCPRGDKLFLSRVLSLISYVVFLAPFRVFGVVPSPVPKADSLSIASRSWVS
jgi:hypothetical protein